MIRKVINTIEQSLVLDDQKNKKKQIQRKMLLYFDEVFS